MYEDYITQIEYPMDLTTTREKVENDEYEVFSEFTKDIRLIFENCREFNLKGFN